jgi:hypothetical protein
VPFAAQGKPVLSKAKTPARLLALRGFYAVFPDEYYTHEVLFCQCQNMGTFL